MMPRRALLVAAALLLSGCAGVPSTPTPAPTLPAPTAVPKPACTFQLGFAEVQRQIPEVVGECVDDERPEPSGNSRQLTTRGLLVWRKADGLIAFTDGHRSWVRGPDGAVRTRMNDERFPWEVDPPGVSLKVVPPGAVVAAPAGRPGTDKPPAPAAVAKSEGKPETGARRPATVVRVVDGDTLDVELDGKTERVRVIGVNTPESVDPRRPVECFAQEASARAKALLALGTAVQVETDPTQDTRDQFGRLLAHVWLPDGRSVGLELIRLGYAHEYTFERPYKYQAEHRAAQKEAEAARRGLWSPDTCLGQPKAPAGAKPAAPAPAPTKPGPPTAAPAKGGAGVAPVNKDDCPASHPIKGNQGSQSTEEWIYHPRGSRSYDVTDPEECFATAVDAEAAGYRAPRN